MDFKIADDKVVKNKRDRLINERRNEIRKKEMEEGTTS